MDSLLRLAALILAVLLGGCYETDFPVFHKGEKTAIAGTFECTSGLSGRKTTSTFTERQVGSWPFASYQYVAEEGDVSLLRKAPSGLWVAQSANEKGRHTFGFVEMADDRTFLVMTPDFLNKSAQIEALRKRFAVEATKPSELYESLLLDGNPDRIADFLLAHDKTLLTVMMKCERQGR
jgi:hypothetical protein